MPKNTILRLLGCALAVCMSLCALTGCSFGVFSGETLDNPKQALSDFIDCLKNEQYDEAMKYVANYSTMGFEKVALIEEGTIDDTLYTMLRESYSVAFIDSDLSAVETPYKGVDMTIDGKQAVMTFTFVSLDLSGMAEVLAAQVTEVGHERAYDGEVFDTEEAALGLIADVFPQTFGGDMSAYYVERELTVEASYSEEGWRLAVDDDFYNALLGK